MMMPRRWTAGVVCLIAVLLALSPPGGAQPASRIPRIGFLSASSSNPESQRLLDAFRRGLNDLGHVEGRTIAIEYRLADFKYERLSRLAADLVELKVDRGVKASELPVEQPAKFELAINVRTAKALGLSIPPSVMLRADHVLQP